VDQAYLYLFVTSTPSLVFDRGLLRGFCVGEAKFQKCDVFQEIVSHSQTVSTKTRRKIKFGTLTTLGNEANPRHHNRLEFTLFNHKDGKNERRQE
jgi:hypothetical protein